MELLSNSADFFVHVAFWTLIHSLWQGTVFAAALALWRSFAAERDYAARSAAATLTLLFLIAAPTVTAMSLALAYEPPATPSIADDFDFSALASMPSALGATEGDYAGDSPAVPLTVDTIAAWLPHVIALLWTIGVTCGAARLLASAVRLHFVRTRSIVADDALAQLCRELAERCGLARAPRLLRSFSARGPYAFGLLRPCIVVPAAWALETSADVLEAAIAHELAHLKRRDLWILALQRLVETTLFFHPAVWYVSRTLNADRERDADRLAAEVLGDPAHYAESLCRLASLVVRPGSPALTLPFHGETRMNLLERVRQVLRTEEAKSGGYSSVGWLCLAPALLAAIFVGQTAMAGSLLVDDEKPAAAEELVIQDADEAEADDYKALRWIFFGLGGTLPASDENSRSLNGDSSDWDLRVERLLTQTPSSVDDPEGEEEEEEEGDDGDEDEDRDEEGDRDEDDEDEDEEGDDEDEDEDGGPVADLRRQFAEEKARLDETMRAEAQALEQKYKQHMIAAQEQMAAAMAELQAAAQRRARELEQKFAEAAAQRQGERRVEEGSPERVPGLDADDLTPRERRMLGVIRSLEARLRELESRLPRDGERREGGDRPREERREGDRPQEERRDGDQPREERSEGDERREEEKPRDGDRPQEEAPRAEGERATERLQPRSEEEAQERQFGALSERLYAALRSDDLVEERRAEFARRAILDVFGYELSPEQLQIVLERSRGDLAGFRQLLTRLSQAKKE